MARRFYQKCWGGILGVMLIMAGCAKSPAAIAQSAKPQVPLTVFAASSLSDAFQEIGKQFEKNNPGTRVEFNFAGSQQLAQQIVQGAQADVFASANQKQMDVVIQSGMAITGQDKVFAHNRLVVIFPKDNSAGIIRLQDLAKPGIKVLLAAKEVPVGQYSLDFLGKADKDGSFSSAFQAGVLKNVVSYEENVRAILSKISLGEADAGIVYGSDVLAADRSTVSSLDIPDSLNSVASYPIVSLTGSKHTALAGAFIDFVGSPEGQAVLKQFGFLPVQP